MPLSFRRAMTPVLLAATLAASPALPAAEAPPDEAGRLLAENDLLRKEVELASGDAFYLVLDPSARTLELTLKGAVLRSYRVATVERSDPRIAFVSSPREVAWQGQVWSGGTLVPQRDRDRTELKAPPPSSAEEPAAEPEVAIPPTPEEAYPVPPRYGIRFKEGLFLEVQALGEAAPSRSLGNRMSAWWEDLKEALRPAPTDRLRLRVSLAHADSDTLYRSLPPDTKLLILPLPRS